MTILPVVLGDNPHVSVSTIESYIACPRKVWRQKFAPKDQRLPFQSSGALIAGSAAHKPIEKAVEARNKLRLSRWPDDWERITRPAEKWYATEFKEREQQDKHQWAEGERDRAFIGGWYAAQALLAAVKGLDIVSVEEEFEFPLRTRWRVKGRKDGRLRNRALVDLKTEAANPSAQWKWTQEKADSSLQAGIYVAHEMHVHGSDVPDGFLFVVARKKEGAVAKVFPTVITRPRAAMAVCVARLVSIFIENGIFPRPRPGCWGCPLNGDC